MNRFSQVRKLQKKYLNKNGMANTYRRVSLQIVFAVKNRQALLDKSWRGDVFKYIAGIIKTRNHYSYAVNGTSDHIHIFMHYNCQELIGDLVREIKKASTSYINDRNLCHCKFQWQSGFGIFSYSHHEKNKMIKYIENQEEHHRKINFKQEYMAALRSNQIEFKNDYVFDFFESTE